MNNVNLQKSSEVMPSRFLLHTSWQNNYNKESRVDSTGIFSSSYVMSLHRFLTVAN